MWMARTVPRVVSDGKRLKVRGLHPSGLAPTAAACQAPCGGLPGPFARARMPGLRYPQIPANHIRACRSCRTVTYVSSRAHDPNICGHKSKLDYGAATF